MVLMAGCAQQPPAETGNVAGQGNAVEKTPEKTAENTFDPSKLTSWDLAALKSSGASVKCEIEQDTAGKLQNSTVYLKGDKMRVETESNGRPVAVIFKGGETYAAISNYPACAWIKFSMANTSGPTAPPRTPYGAPDESQLEKPPVSYTCVADTFGDEKFETSGTVCTMADILSAPCKQINDTAARQKCEEALGGTG
jgi:hypothetical protein